MNYVDFFVLNFLRQPWSGQNVIDSIAVLCLENDLIKGGLIIGLLWFAWFSAGNDLAHRRQLVITCMVGAIAAAALSRMTTHLFPFSVRPFELQDLNIPRPLSVLYEVKGGSFPSDHTALAFAIVTSLFFMWPLVGLLMTLYVFLFIALPRMYLGLHWFSDIIGGALIGITLFFVLSRHKVREWLARPILRWHDRLPEIFYPVMFLVAFGLMTRFEDYRSIIYWALQFGSELLGVK